MAEQIPIARVAIDRSVFPFLVEYFDVDRLMFDDPPLHHAVVKGPGPLYVPGLGANGRRVLVRITYRDGTIEDHWPE